MENTTGKLDQLIEQKVDDKINAFTASIREQISKFITDNGDYSGDYLYTVDKWDTDIPLTFNHIHLRKVQDGLIAGISKHVKEKMIMKETKELLEKVNLLS
jgi:hypothetical protein